MFTYRRRGPIFYMNKGWIKLHRMFIESPLWKYALVAHYPILIQFWLYLLMSVNWEEKKWYDGKQENIIPAGSIITSQLHLAEYFDVSRQTIRTCLQHLENMKMITSTTTNKWTQIWIVNWGKYQSEDEQSNQQDNQRLDNDKTTTRQRLDTTKEYKNIRIKEERDTTSSKIFLLNIPEIELEELATQFSCTQSQIVSKGASLYDYCQSKGKIYKDYRAFLRNALRKDFGNRKIIANITPDLPQEISEEGLARLQDMKRKILGNKLTVN